MSSKNFNFNETDFDSPGYEYLRSYQSMSILMHKLVALNYQNEFCSQYKCPPIHRYYFSIPNKSSCEQLFVYTCLCAWLIKEKCQMNLELEPDEYEDPDVTISVIMEAIGLLLNSDKNSVSKTISWNRLRQGFGPEVVWTLNILADRAMELMLESRLEDPTIKIIHNNKAASESNHHLPANYITIGQPFVGGGLTTRPLGSYQIDDRSLLFEEEDEDDDKDSAQTDQLGIIDDLTPEEWHQRVDRVAESLDWSKISDKVGSFVSLAENISPMVESRNAVQTFLEQTRPLLTTMSSKIDKQMKLISSRENSIQSNLGSRYESFLSSRQDYSKELARHSELSQQVDVKTDLFEELNQNLEQLDKLIENRIKELNDGSVLNELETKIRDLKSEATQIDTQIGLLLHLCGSMHSKMDLTDEDSPN